MKRRLFVPAISSSKQAKHVDPAEAKHDTDTSAIDSLDRPASTSHGAAQAAFKAPFQRKPFMVRQSSNVLTPHLSKTMKPGSASTASAPVSNSSPASSDQKSEYFTVLYTKREKLKKKADKGWQDGVLELVTGAVSILYNSDGKVVSKSKIKVPSSLESGVIIDIGSMAAEIDRALAAEEYRNGSCFVQSSIASAPLMPVSLPMRKAIINKTLPGASSRIPGAAGAGATVAAAGPAKALHDPNAPDAVLLNKDQWQQKQGSAQPVVPVVIDPFLSRTLRPHQHEGVAFMYQCVMGLREQGRSGCILADEMGLGKTLQVITLAWTMLRQGPQGKPAARKVVVVAPATLVNNWAKEVRKWLGNERLQAMVLGSGADGAQKVQDFKHGPIFKMLITSYETVRKHAAELAGTCDLLVCDEGHRLKAAGGNKTINALLQLNCPRRVLLTGTPVQNDLQEFYALISFVTPELLGPMATFKRVYGDPITRSRDKDASAVEKELGLARAKQLQSKVDGFVLRRTQHLLAKHLPPLAVHTVFCRPSQLQVSIYRHMLRSESLRSLLHGSGAGFDSVLPVITAIRKLCNHPDLLAAGAAADEADEADEAAAGCTTSNDMLGISSSKVSSSWLSAETRNFERGMLDHSGKLTALAALLESVFSCKQRVVVVSTSTASLDLVDALLCQPQGYAVVRIDGSTGVDDRQVVVDNFNTRGMGQVFLLSTRAGGAGLNLIGANHLVLYDSDWNPAHDLQAMARIWRDGQTRSCFVYRLLTSGTMEERIYQRQLMKQDLAAAMAGKAGGAKAMSREELKQLFTLDSEGRCSSREMLQGCTDIRWLELEGQELSPGLAAMVGSGTVCSINQERCAMAQKAEEQQQQQQADGEEEEGAQDSDDVEAMETDDDGNDDFQVATAGKAAAATAGSGEASKGSSGRLKRVSASAQRACADTADDVDCLEVEDW